MVIYVSNIRLVDVRIRATGTKYTHSQTTAAEGHVRDALVTHAYDACLLAVNEAHVAHVYLHLLERDTDVVRLLVVRLASTLDITHNCAVGREAEVVMRLNTDDIREEVAAFEREVFDDEVETVIRVLDAWNGDVAHLRTGLAQCIRYEYIDQTHSLDEGRQENVANILPQLALECEFSLAVENKVFRQLRPILAEFLVDLEEVYPVNF